MSLQAPATRRVPKATKAKRKSSKPSEPHLPPELLKELLEQPAAKEFESLVFNDFMRQVRIDIVNVNSAAPLDPDAPIDLDSTHDDNEFSARGRGLLHHAVMLSDHLLALEMIRYSFTTPTSWKGL